MISLFPDEQLLTESTNGGVVLTTHRICYECKEIGRSYNQSIMLEHITSCENIYDSKLSLLTLAGVTIVIALLAISGGSIDTFVICSIISIVALIIYYLTRINLIIISSPSTKMRIVVTRMKRDRVLEFINKVEQAKHKRIISLNNKNKFT